MCDVGAFCGNPALVRKGRHGKTPAYDDFVPNPTRLPPTPPALALATLALSVACWASTAVAQTSAAPLRQPQEALQIAGPAFGERLEIEVHGLPRVDAERALNGAWDAVLRAEREVAGLAPSLRAGRATLAPDLFALLARASSFCSWSDGASGPHGGAVYRLWAESAAAGSLPTPDELEEAASSTRCTRLTLVAETRQVEVLPGSELDLRGFALGWAVDLAVRSLAEAGAGNLRVTLGPVTRAMGGGPAGAGWSVALPTLSASGNTTSRVLLRDQALAVAEPARSALLIAGERILPAFDLRSGRPATGVSSVVAVTALAADAEPLALAMSVLGANGGQLRLGSLRPKPSVLWLLGEGDTAVVASSNWSAVRKP